MKLMSTLSSLSALYIVGNNMFLASSALTRADIEATVRTVYMPDKSEVGKGNGLSKGADPHTLYVRGTQPAGAGGGGKSRSRHSKSKQQQQCHRNDRAGVVGPSYHLDPVRGQWR